MRTLCILVTFLFLGFIKVIQQKQDIYYYRPDVGMYIKYDKTQGRLKIPFKENWDFYFSLKNDSVAVIQEIKNKRILDPKEYKVSLAIDSMYVKRHLDGKYYRTEKSYFHKIIM